MNMQTTKWPAYTPAQARAMEDALLAVYAKEKNPNAGKLPLDYSGSFNGHGSVGGKKSRAAQPPVSEMLRDKVIAYVKKYEFITSRQVMAEFHVTDTTARRVLRNLWTKKILEVIEIAPCGSKVYAIAK